MRALTVEELGFVSGGGTPLAQQAEQAAWDAFNSLMKSLGIRQSAGGGYSNASLRGLPPGVGGAVLGAVGTLAGGLVTALRDGEISQQEWTMIAVTTIVGAALGAAGLYVDASITTAAAQWVWRVGMAALAGAAITELRT